MKLTKKMLDAMDEQLNLYKQIAARCVEEGNMADAEAYFHRYEGALETLYEMELVSELEGARRLAHFWG
ncbi:MAG TPA: hypothetical protein IAA32_09600 [Candidatus Butyricicoccus stercorigallinarum]|nr:hypothetical protein [Candidatus Butyricicoccus stercorigallinarum]